MIKSMTGYGRASTKIQIGSCNIEIRSLNSRNLDIKFSGLSLSAELEQKIRSLLSEQIQRGSVKIFIDFDNHDAERFKSFDEANFNSILEVIERVEEKYDQKLDLSSIVNLNDLFKHKEIEINDDEKTILMFSEALKNLDKTRLEEGRHIEKDFLKRLGLIKKEIKDMEVLTFELTKTRKKEISEKIRFYTGQDSIDEGRLMQEVAYLIERSDITEEIVRVNIHINAFTNYLKLNEPVGKRLGFLAQEINREVNTIGSKSPIPLITSKIVEVKNELEKIKEQIQNIL
ncbi:YicC family protein [Candidatus Marinimicrobia bacterium]|nr:YicC family protein [Candidatus Neomarinimicrobiota bacterium]MDB2351311.1 YicC family protein [Candidatus Neomarinimicrobiota bacterium]|tara:strand:+ start:6332 stop:7192 length:861 start_codon:yes stop_codon:yes gene_type:complete